MNFSFELEGAMMTGNINPEVMTSMGTMFGALFGGVLMVMMVIYLAIIIFMIISRWRVFTKAKLPGWGILIPIYNIVLMFKVGGMSGRRTLSLLFPPLFLVMMIILCFQIPERFNKHRAFGLGILFVGIVFIPILAFDNSKRGKQAKKAIATPVAKAPIKKAPAKKPSKKPIKKVKTLQSKK